MLIKYSTGLTIALEVDEKPWIWNRTRLCQLTIKKSLHPRDGTVQDFSGRDRP